jgi:hypothetical protein
MQFSNQKLGIFKSGCLVSLLVAIFGGLSSPSTADHLLITRNGIADSLHQRSGKSTGRAQPRGRPIAWRVLGTPGPKGVRIGTTVGWCPRASRPRPKIQRVRQGEQRDALILTAFLVHPAPEGPSGKPSCLGVELSLEYVVTFRRDRNGRPLFDGSVSPPRKRWPLPKRQSSTSVNQIR